MKKLPATVHRLENTDKADLKAKTHHRSKVNKHSFCPKK